MKVFTHRMLLCVTTSRDGSSCMFIDYEMLEFHHWFSLDAYLLPVEMLSFAGTHVIQKVT